MTPVGGVTWRRVACEQQQQVAASAGARLRGWFAAKVVRRQPASKKTVARRALHSALHPPPVFGPAVTVPTLISRGCGQTETAGAGKQPSLFHERHTAPASCPRAPHARNAKARADRGAMVESSLSTVLSGTSRPYGDRTVRRSGTVGRSGTVVTVVTVVSASAPTLRLALSGRLWRRRGCSASPQPYCGCTDRADARIEAQRTPRAPRMPDAERECERTP